MRTRPLPTYRHVLRGHTAPLPPRARLEIGRHLRRAAKHPWPATLRTRFGDQRLVIYTRVPGAVFAARDSNPEPAD
ncbi:MAG: hypothetical protein M3143_00875 [Actinomycetota bacterium]|nr:hypothetical protein [Actinomycetota bacterium]